ncbi:hypothetical protein [Pseudomonas sp. EA_15y_Pfl2_R67]
MASNRPVKNNDIDQESAAHGVPESPPAVKQAMKKIWGCHSHA